MPDGVHCVVQLYKDRRGAEGQGCQAEQGREHARPGLVGASDDFLNGSCNFRPDHAPDFRCEPAFCRRLSIKSSGHSDGDHNDGGQRQQGVERDGGAEARSIVVDPFDGCLPEDSRQRLEQTHEPLTNRELSPSPLREARRSGSGASAG